MRNTKELEDHVYEIVRDSFDPQLSREEIKYLVNVTLNGLAEGILREDRVILRGFGSFRRVVRKGRTYNVKGTPVTKEDRFTVVFQPGRTLKAQVRSMRPEDVV